MSKKSMSNDTSKPANNYLNVKIVEQWVVSWLTIIKIAEGRTLQEIVTEALKEYIDNHYRSVLLAMAKEAAAEENNQND